MRCPQCSFDNPPEMAFCGRCGAKVVALCPSCGFANPEGFAFCGKCGSRLTPDAGLLSREPSARFTSPQAYTPKHLAEKILTSRGALEGERKQVTVLFADLKGSMELLADRDPEEARKFLDPVLERMMDAVHRYEGTVNQVMGDGIMALFGAPLAHEDHAVRACYAALRMQEAVKRYAEEIRRTEGIPLQIRVGLNSGEVVVRSIGSDLHMDYTAVGQTTHLAARMEQLANPGSTLLTAETLRLAEGFVQVAPLGPVPVKGLAEPMEVFELLGAGPTRRRFEAAAARGLTRFVGRQQEMEALAQALERARAGHGQIVAPVGEPGVGKSRLFWEFTRSHRTHGWLVYETGSAPYGKTTPYFPIINLLKTCFEVEPRDDARKIHAKVLGRLLTLDKAFEPTVPPFLALLDVPVEDGQIVETIERLYPDRLPEHIERLAHHAFRGEAWEKAVTYLRQAGAKALARSSNREALAYFEQALTALSHLPETRETLEQAIDVRFDLRNALYPLAEFGRIEGYLREAEILAKALDDQRRLGWVLTYMSGHYLHTGGHATEARTFAQRVQAIGETLSDLSLQVAAQYYLLAACLVSGDYRATEHHCRRLVQSLQGDRTRERFGLAVFPAVQSRSFLARTLAERGVFDEGDAHGQEAIRIAETLDHPFSLIWACLGLAYLNSVRGELSQAARLLERAVAQSRDWNITVLTPIAMASLGHVYAWSGRIGEGVSWLQQALTAYESAGIGHFQSISVVQLGEAYLLADQVEEARACADRAVMLARERGERGHEAWALRLLGEIASHHDRPDAATAEAHYGAAMALASELGMRPLQAHCHLGLGELYRRTGRHREAQEELSTATTMYREMEMRFWLEQAEAELNR